jgi:hypothetical protein
VRIRAEELNTNRETVRQIVKGDVKMRKTFAKMVPRILTDDQKQRRFTFYLIFYAVQRFLIGALSVMKRGASIRPGNKKTGHAVENTEFILPEKSMNVLVAGQDHACVFLGSQEDSSL